jgi:hypothetical protein
MSTAKIFPLVGTVGLYKPETGWTPFRACLMAVFIVVVAMVSGLVSYLVVTTWWVPAQEILDGALEAQLLFSQLVMQVVTVALVLWAAVFYRSDRNKALALVPVTGGTATFVKAFALIVLVSGIFSALAWLLRPQDVLTDLAGLWPLMKGESWWLMLLVAVIGAPLSEELLFRGFLQSALAQSRLGFWGAALITNTAWAALHAGYTLTGLVDVFIAGALFSWVLWRTGSLWVPIVCHGLYNGLIFAVLWVMPMPEGLTTLPL